MRAAAPRGPHRLGRAWAMLGLLLLCACSVPAPAGTLAAAGYSGDFEFHFGSLPRELATMPSTPGADSGGGVWRPARLLGVPPGRRGASELWLRTRLVGPVLQRPTLDLRLAANHAEFFLDSDPLDAQTAAAAPFDAPTHVRGEYLLALPANYVGRVLTLRLLSRSPAIGLEAVPRLGEPAAVTFDLLRRRADIVVCCFLMSLSALCCIALFVGRRSERAYLHYALGCISYTLSFIGFSGLGGLAFRWPLPHYPTHVLFNGIATIAMLSFVMRMVDAGPGQVLARLRWLYAGFVAVYVLVMLARPTLVPMLMGPHRLLSIVLAGGLLAAAIRGWRRGNADARLLAWAIFVMIALTLPEYMLIAGLIQGELGAVYVPTIMTFLGALAVMLVRRFFASQAQALHLQIEHRLAEQRLSAQQALLQASARMAAGDLDQPIVADEGSPLRPLAQSLDGMRQEMRNKIQLLDRMQATLRGQVDALEARNREVGQLNLELRRQIEQRSRRLFDMLLPVVGGPPSLRALQAGELLAEH